MTTYHSLFELIPNFSSYHHLNGAEAKQIRKKFVNAMQDHMMSDYQKSVFNNIEFNKEIFSTFDVQHLLAYLTFTIRMDRFIDGILDEHIEQGFILTALLQLKTLTDSSKRPTFDIAYYVTRQLAKTKNKRFEAYVISRIIHLLNDLSLKFVTQQYVRRSDERIALTDLYFPQLGIHIEVDEGHHFISLQHSNHPRLSHVLQKETDAIREQDIINVTGHQILRVNVFRDEYHQPISLTSIHQQVDVILNTIRLKKKQLIDENKFTLWEPEKEFNPQTYIERGYISLADDVIFKTQADACNCFGHTYKSLQRGGANHAIESDTLIWFPRLYQNDRWINSISADGLIITEKSVDDEITHQHIDHWRTGRQKRIVFARVKDNLSSRAMYRFLGVFKLKLAEPEVGAVWERIADRVKTYAATQI